MSARQIPFFPDIVFGIRKDLTPDKLTNIPPDALRVKIRQRSTKYTKAFVRTASGIREFCVQRDKVGFSLVLEQGCNLRG